MHNISGDGSDGSDFSSENLSQQPLGGQDSSIVPHEQQSLWQEHIGLGQEHEFDFHQQHTDFNLQPSDWSQQHTDFNQFHDEWGQQHTDWNQQYQADYDHSQNSDWSQQQGDFNQYQADLNFHQGNEWTHQQTDFSQQQGDLNPQHQFDASQYQNTSLNEQAIDINHNQDWSQEHQANLYQPHEADWSQANQADLNSQSSHSDYQYQNDLIPQDHFGGNVQPRSAADDMQEKADLLKQAADKEAEAKQLSYDASVYYQSPGHNFIDKAAEAAQKAAEAQAEADRLRKLAG